MRGYYNQAQMGTRYVLNPPYINIHGGYMEAEWREADPAIDYFIPRGAVGSNLTISPANDPTLRPGTIIHVEGGGTDIHWYNQFNVTGPWIGTNLNIDGSVSGGFIVRNWNGRFGWKRAWTTNAGAGSDMKDGLEFFALDGRGGVNPQTPMDNSFLGHYWDAGNCHPHNYGIIAQVGWELDRPAGNTFSNNKSHCINVYGTPIKNIWFVGLSICCSRFAGLTMKTDTKGEGSFNIVAPRVMHCNFYNPESEHIYNGYVGRNSTDPILDANGQPTGQFYHTHCTVSGLWQNNVGLFAGTESAQIQRQAGNLKYTNNLILSSAAMRRNSFQRFNQGMGQYGFYSGGQQGQDIVFEKNIEVGSATGHQITVHEETLQYSRMPDGTLIQGNGNVRYRQNFVGGTMGFVFRFLINNAEQKDIRFHIENNWIKPDWRAGYGQFFGDTEEFAVHYANTINQSHKMRYANNKVDMRPNGNGGPTPYFGAGAYYTDGGGNDLNAQFNFPILRGYIQPADWWKYEVIHRLNESPMLCDIDETRTWAIDGQPMTFQTGQICMMGDQQEWYRRTGAASNVNPRVNIAGWERINPLTDISWDMRLDPNIASNAEYLDAGIGLLEGLRYRVSVSDPVIEVTRRFLSRRGARIAAIKMML